MLARRLSLTLMLFAAATFASCDKNNGENDNGNGNGEPTEQTADVSYKFDGGADYLTIFNVQIKYTDVAGKTVTEEVKSLPWEKSLTSVKLPFTASIELSLTAIENYEEKDKYELGQGFAILYNTSDGRTYGSMNSGKTTIGKDKIAAYQEKIINSEKSASVEIPVK